MPRRNRSTPEIQSGSIADIAFLLLIFFMVCTTFQREKSIPMVLPPAYDGPAGKISESRVLSLIINAQNEIMVEGQNIISDIEPIITEHLKSMVDTDKKPYISIKLHEDSNYDQYINVLAMVKSSIKNLKQVYALQKYGTQFDQLTKDQYHQLSKMMSITISESQYAI
jgi:biopolymer transport protein ExbD